jgi:mannitol/fructose-specific phosphotransferase system IIA component (Ntr-type)
MDNKTEKFLNLKQQQNDLLTKKIRFDEQCKTKEQDLKNLVKEIKDNNYEPNELQSIIQKKEKEIEQELATYEADLSKVSQQLSAIEEG